MPEHYAEWELLYFKMDDGTYIQQWKLMLNGAEVGAVSEFVAEWSSETGEFVEKRLEKSIFQADWDMSEFESAEEAKAHEMANAIDVLNRKLCVLQKLRDGIE